jgi:hypothetical protein
MKSEQRKALLNVSWCPANCVFQLLHITHSASTLMIQRAGGRFHQSPTYGIPITS